MEFHVSKIEKAREEKKGKPIIFRDSFSSCFFMPEAQRPEGVEQRCVIYFLKLKHKRLIKIGLTSSPSVRRDALRSHNRLDIDYEQSHVVVCPNKKTARSLEGLLHWYCRSNRTITPEEREMFSKSQEIFDQDIALNAFGSIDGLLQRAHSMAKPKSRIYYISF